MSKKSRTKRMRAAEAASAAIADYNNTLIQNKKAQILECITIDALKAHGVLDEGGEMIQALFSPNGKARGGQKGVHGFIFEILEVYGNNAELAANGKHMDWKLLDNNGPFDIQVKEMLCQLKASQKKGVLAFIEYAEKYPGSDGKTLYIVPKDIYEHYMTLLKLSAKEAGKLRKPEYTQWKKIQDYQKQHPEAIIRPGRHTYKEIQHNAAPSTLRKEHQNVETIKENRTADVCLQYQPTWKGTLESAGYGAAVEGLSTAAYSAAEIAIHNYKTDKEWDSEDTKAVKKAGGVAAAQGAVKHAAMYQTINRFPSEVTGPATSAACTFVFEETKDIIKCVKKEENGKDLAVNTVWNALDAAVNFGTVYLSQKYLTPLIEKYTHSQLIGKAGGYIIGTGLSVLVLQPAKQAINNQLMERGVISPQSCQAAAC